MQKSKALYLLKNLLKNIDVEGNAETAQALAMAIQEFSDSLQKSKENVSSKRKNVMSYSGRGDIPGGFIGLLLKA